MVRRENTIRSVSPRWFLKDEDMRAAKYMVLGSWGDPEWPIDYMKDAYKAWMNMKTYWDKGPEFKKQDSSLRFS